MGFDYDAYLQDRYEDSCGEEEENGILDDEPEEEDTEEEDTEDVVDAFNRRQESMAISDGTL